MITTHPTLFKKTSTGATQIWYKESEGGKYRTVSGQINGKHTVSGWTICVPTNEGRSNERNPEQQCLFEVQADYKKKLERDYHTSVTTISETIIFEPMLANKYSDRADKIDFKKQKWFSQPKLDGFRCIANKDGLWTRNGKPILSAPHIVEALSDRFKEEPELILDGELYNHELHDDFNTLASLIKKQKPNKDELALSKKMVQYHVYDVPSVKGTFQVRSIELDNISECYTSQSSPIKFVETKWIIVKSHLDEIYSQYLEDGYEGQMLRDGKSLYQNKRTNDLLKRKEFLDEEFEVVDILSGLGNWNGYGKRATLRLKDGRTFGAGISGTQEFTKELLENKNKYIGNQATVRFFNLTPDGVPRFGVVKEFNRSM